MDLSQLDALCSDLIVAAKTLRTLRDSSHGTSASNEESGNEALIPSAVSRNPEDEVALAQNNLCGIAARLEAMLSGPSCFIRRMATQNQLLACLKWLGEHQIVAYIPLSNSISLEELADLADISEHTLSRVVRMTATAGFLNEPQLGHVAHTPLSLSFTTDLLYFDATMFLANKVAPLSLDLDCFAHKSDAHSSSTTDVQSQRTYGFFSQEPQLNRQWLAYRQSIGGMKGNLSCLLNLLNWHSLGEASVVHICDTYTKLSHTVVHTSQALRLQVQTYDYAPTEADLSGLGEIGKESTISQRITARGRKPTAEQPVKDAAVYILQPSFGAASTKCYSPKELLAIELRSHFSILQANPTALLILAPAMLPEPGSVAVDLEAQARLLDFAEMQFNRKNAIEVTELLKLTGSICDKHGRLVVKNRLWSVDGATIALAVKYQPFS